MRKLTVVESVTLDGVMQAPGGADEDTRGGFDRGGWAAPYADEVMGAEMGSGMGTSALLFGRRTYEQFFDYWPNAPRPNRFSDVLDNATKFVASNTSAEPLPWQNSTLLQGDAGEAVAALKDDDGSDLVVLGSGLLVQTLLARSLVDELVLLVHPLVLGTGTRLFRDGGPASAWRLAKSVPTTTGVTINRFHPTA